MTNHARARNPFHRYQSTIPVHLFTHPRTLHRHAFTYRGILRATREELDAAWSVHAYPRTVAKVGKWDRGKGKYMVVEKWEKPEMENDMEKVTR